MKETKVATISLQNKVTTRPITKTPTVEQDLIMLNQKAVVEALATQVVASLGSKCSGTTHIEARR